MVNGFTKTRANNVKRILAFHCHPDDVEWNVAGTLALLEQRGWEVHLAVMAGGEVGSATLSPQAIRERRMRENADSAAVLGARFHYAGGHDLQIVYNVQQLRQAVRVMRDVDPDIVLAPPPMDYLIDHEETSRLVRTAAFIACVPNFDCGVPTKPTSRIPHLYYCNAFGQRDCFGRPLPLHFVVDITSVFDTKREMLACHASQREWLKHVNGMDNYLEDMERDARQQGKLVDVTYGEGFIQHLGAGLFLDARVNDHLMGEKVAKPVGASVEVKVAVRCPSDIERIEICRNNRFPCTNPSRRPRSKATFRRHGTPLRPQLLRRARDPDRQ